MGDFEITALVLSEHEVFRRKFSALPDAEDLTAAWAELAAALEVHAVAEEQLLYPLLARAGTGGAAESDEAVREHNDIRHAVQAVEAERVGEQSWWQAVQAAQDVNASHMAEEETDFLPDFKDAVGEEQRDELGLRWLQFHDEHQHADGLSAADADPQAVRTADVDQADVGEVNVGEASPAAG